jgi:FAD:protein FMN transferase
MQHHEGFRAMNTDVNLFFEAALPPMDAIISIKLLFEQQEACFSRFRPASMLSALNRGEAVTDRRFADGCRLALEAHGRTGGLFNPMILAALAEAGYDRSFDDVADGRPRAQAVPDPRDALVLQGDTVSLRSGQLDLGGIVKGWTVDLAIGLVADRYPDSFVNAGGDLRCIGSEEDAAGWVVGLDDPDGNPAWKGAMRGAVATSSARKRRWTAAGGGAAHHLIDPRTGLPADGFDQVSVWADQCWEAEVWAKAVLIGGLSGVEACRQAGHTLLTFPGSGELANESRRRG